MLIGSLLKSIYKFLVSEQARRQITVFVAIVLCIFAAIFVLAEPVDLIIMLDVIDMKHHLLDLITYNIVDLHHCSARLSLIFFIIRL